MFAAHGFDLAIVARRAAELEALVARCRSEQKVRVHVPPMDLLAPNAPAKLVEQLEDAGLDPAFESLLRARTAIASPLLTSTLVGAELA